MTLEGYDQSELEQLLFEKDFAQDIKGTEEVFKKVDAHYLLILTFLLISLREDKVNQNQVSNEVEGLLKDLEYDVNASIFKVIENTVVNSMAGSMFSVITGMSGERLEDVVGRGKPLSSTPYDLVLYEMAVAKAGGKLSVDSAKRTIIQSGLQTAQATKMFQDAYQDLLRATRNTDSRLKRIIRDISTEILQVEGLLARNNKQMAKVLLERLTDDSVFKRLTQEGLLGIVDAGGKRWQLDTYTKMVVNTKVTDAHLQATKQTGLQIGADLAVISYNATTTDACLSWEGVVVSVNGLTEGYPNLDDAIATNEVFHPNCRHHINLISTFEDLTDIQQLEHKMKMRAVKNPELRPYRRKSDSY